MKPIRVPFTDIAPYIACKADMEVGGIKEFAQFITYELLGKPQLPFAFSIILRRTFVLALVVAAIS